MKMRGHKNRFCGSVVETLENRRLLSGDVSVSGSVMTIRGDFVDQNVELYESYTNSVRQTMVRMDMNGNGNFTDVGDLNGKIYTGIDTVLVRLGLGNDRLSITLADPFDGALRSYDLRTGVGNDIVRFTNPVGNDIRNSNVSLTLDTAGGDDQVIVALNRFNNSTLNANITTGEGNDTLRLYGGDDIANSTVNVTAQMGTGNDLAEERLDWEGFDLIGAGSVWRTSFSGNDGNDILNAVGELGNSSGDVAGTMDIALIGDLGDDQITFAMDRLTLRGGTLRLRGNGFAGSDRLSLSGSFEGSGTLDIILKGNGGSDVLTSTANRTGGAGQAILDGGAGNDFATAPGTLTVQKVGIEG